LPLGVNEGFLHPPETFMERIECLMDIGLDLARVTKLANQVTSPFLMNFMTVFVVSTIGMLYSCATIFFSLDKNVTWDSILFSTTTFSFAMMYLWRIWQKCNSAQMYLDSREQALAEIQKDIIENYGQLNRRLRWKAEAMTERLSCPDAYAPSSYFILNRATILPFVAAVITYFIIILQFKLSEKSGSMQPTNSSAYITNSTVFGNSTDITTLTI
jgi:hypothetical protein